MATRPALDANFEPPRSIAELNMPGVHDTDPWVSPDGTILYFTRGSRLWQATRVAQ